MANAHLRTAGVKNFLSVFRHSNHTQFFFGCFSRGFKSCFFFLRWGAETSASPWLEAPKKGTTSLGTLW